MKVSVKNDLHSPRSYFIGMNEKKKYQSNGLSKIERKTERKKHTSMHTHTQEVHKFN